MAGLLMNSHIFICTWFRYNKGQNFAEFFTEYGDTDIEAENKLAETKRKLIDTIKGLD